MRLTRNILMVGGGGSNLRQLLTIGGGTKLHSGHVNSRLSSTLIY